MSRRWRDRFISLPASQARQGRFFVVTDNDLGITMFPAAI